MQNDNSDDFLGASDEEKLRMENELLKLKMQAELGEQFHQENDIPADMENMFLKNMLAFHQSIENTVTIKVFEKLGKPAIKKAADLNDEQLTEALKDLEALLAANQMEVDYLSTYDDRTKYIFLTE
mgnify:CR=1 FL=1